MDLLTGIALGHINRLGREVADHAREVDRANGEIRRANSTIESQARTIIELRRELEHAQAGFLREERDAAVAARQGLEKTIRSLQSEVERMRGLYGTANRYIKTLEWSERNSAKTGWEKGREEGLASVGAEVESLRRATSQAEADLSLARAELASAQAQRDALLSERAGMESALEGAGEDRAWWRLRWEEASAALGAEERLRLHHLGRAAAFEAALRAVLSALPAGHPLLATGADGRTPLDDIARRAWGLAQANEGAEPRGEPPALPLPGDAGEAREGKAGS